MNKLPAAETACRSWRCRLGPVTLVLPNLAWRRRAIEAHDLHHVLTGYACTMSGECEMAAWEFGAGRMPHWGATLFCLPLVLAGLVFVPRRMFRAFAAGRRSHSLHGAEDCQRWIAGPLSTALVELTNQEAAGGTWSNSTAFALLILRCCAITVLPVAALMYLATQLG
jgi:hypothetical protein